jgi:hypothetical protein
MKRLGSPPDQHRVGVRSMRRYADRPFAGLLSLVINQAATVKLVKDFLKTAAGEAVQQQSPVAVFNR